MVVDAVEVPRVIEPPVKKLEKCVVVVALVPVAFTKVKFWNEDWLATPVPVAVIELNCPSVPKMELEKKLVVVACVPVALVQVSLAN